MKIEIIKNIKDGRRHRLKGQILEVTPWKAEELLKKKYARVLMKKSVNVPIEKVETAQKKDLKETR